MKQTGTFHLIVERDEDGIFVGTVPELPGCHTQAADLETLEERAKEATALYLEEFPRARQGSRAPRFVGVHSIEV